MSVGYFEDLGGPAAICVSRDSFILWAAKMGILIGHSGHHRQQVFLIERFLTIDGWTDLLGSVDHLGLLDSFHDNLSVADFSS